MIISLRTSTQYVCRLKRCWTNFQYSTGQQLIINSKYITDSPVDKTCSRKCEFFNPFVTLLASPTSSTNTAISGTGTSSSTAATNEQSLAAAAAAAAALSMAPSWRRSDHPSVRRDHVDRRICRVPHGNNIDAGLSSYSTSDMVVTKPADTTVGGNKYDM